MKNFQELKTKSLDKSKELSEVSKEIDKVIDDKKSIVHDILAKITDEKSNLLPKEDYDTFRDDVNKFQQKVDTVLEENVGSEQQVKSELNEHLQVAEKGKLSAKANLEQSIKSNQKMKNEQIKEKSHILIRENEEQAKKYAQLASILYEKLREHHQEFNSQKQDIEKLSVEQEKEMSKVVEFKENAQILALASGSALSPESRGKFIEAKTPPSLSDTKDQLYNCAGTYDEEGNVYLGESYYNDSKYAKTRGKIDENGIVYRSEKSTLTGRFHATKRIGRVDQETGSIFIGKDRFSEQRIATFRDEKIEIFTNSLFKQNRLGKIINF